MAEPRIRVPVSFPGADSAEQLEQQLDELNAAGGAASAALSRGEISAAEFDAEMKLLRESTKNVEAALRATNAALDAQVDAIGEQVAAELEAAAATEAFAVATAKAAASDDLADQAEREALAIQHEIEMMAHEERQLGELTAAREQENAVINREIGALEANERARLQAAGATGQGSAAEARAKETADRATTAVWAEVAALENAEREAKQFANAEFGAAGSMEHFTVDASAAASASGKLSTAAGGVNRGMGSAQQSITAASYAFQDFTSTSGDLGAKLNSITNNLPTLLVGLGGLGVAISVAATAGIALYRNWDSIASFWEERNPFPQAAEDVGALKRELERTKDALEKMEKAGVGNASQLEEYNRLRAETARLEKEVADQQERQQLLKKLRGGSTEEDEGRAKGFAEATKGTDFEAKLTQAYANDINNEIAQAQLGTTLRVQAIRQSNKTDEEKNRLAKEEWDSLQATINRLRDPANDPAKLAEALYVRLGRGEEGAFKALDRLMDGTGVVFGDLKKQIDAANPHIKKLVDGAIDEIEEWFKSEQSAARTKDARVKEAGKELDAVAKAEKHSADAQKSAEDEIDDFVKHATAERRKAATHAFNLEIAAIEADAAESKRRGEAEARRVESHLGEEAKRQFADTVRNEAQATGGDPQQIATKLAATLAARWARAPIQGGLGATAQGAQFAAQRLAGGAGFRVTVPQIQAAQRPAGPPARPPAKKLAKKKPLRGAALARQRAAESEIDKLTKEQLGTPKRRQANQPKPKGPGVAALARPIAETQTAVAQLEAQQARDRQIIEQLSTNARRLNVRATEQGPTALNGGSSVA